MFLVARVPKSMLRVASLASSSPCACTCSFLTALTLSAYWLVLVLYVFWLVFCGCCFGLGKLWMMCPVLGLALWLRTRGDEGAASRG